jgi:acyl-CoA thioester hydrolase
MSRPRYFTENVNSSYPAPLSCSVARLVRFEETDPLNIVWHGHYASYFEDARVGFGKLYGIGYTDFYNAGIVTPIKRIRIDYERPLHFDEECRITATLFWNEAARLNFEYEIVNAAAESVARGYTVQLFLKLSGELLYAKPNFYEAFCQKWQNGVYGVLKSPG